ncbi:hypothetical protein AGMMS50229_00930 [Campylobacterota bacterium]|nr:hypothetical protein AGMMS50229_00930 [Campylobacterota bacterium]
MKRKYILMFCVVVSLLLQACSLQKTAANEGSKALPSNKLISVEDLAPYFDQYLNAAMVLSDGVSSVIYNESFSARQLSPYSTFKILNALIALEVGVVKIDNSIRKWDGTKYDRVELNQDQDLASAMRYSAVWYYQQLAREIGKNNMQNYLNKIGYGNMDISGGIDRFWLSSSLLISANEQLDFIIRLYYNRLPFSQKNMEYVKSIMRQSGYPIEVYGKTGSSGNGDGWFIGYALLNNKPYFFATYIAGNGATSPQARDKTIKIIEGFLSR